MYGSREIEIDPPAPVALVTLAAAKDALSITGTGTDDAINGLIAEASQQIELYCGTIFSKRSVTEIHHLEEGGTTIILAYAPALTLTSVTVQSQAQNAADYRLNGMYGMLRRVDGACFDVGENVIVYDAGYLAANVPPAVTRAVLELVKLLYAAQQPDVDADEADKYSSDMTVDVGQTVYRKLDERTMSANGVTLPNRIALMLAAYKRNFSI